MDVTTILKDSNQLWGKRLFVTGALRARFNFGSKPHYELAWIVQDRKVKENFQGSLLVVKPGLVKLLNRTISPWLGPFLYNDDVELSAVLSKSSDIKFPAALTDITAFRIERRDKVKEFTFSTASES